jgi:hypothetical protein
MSILLEVAWAHAMLMVVLVFVALLLDGIQCAVDVGV